MILIVVADGNAPIKAMEYRLVKQATLLDRTFRDSYREVVVNIGGNTRLRP